MMYYSLEPEVAGGWGENTVVERIPGKRRVVHKLHYEFDGWGGDGLLETVGDYIVTEKMADAIQHAGLTGFSLDEVEISTSGEFDDFYPNLELPDFLWLKITGIVGQDDFGLKGLRIVVSERALNVLKSVGLNNTGSITPIEI